MVLLVQESAPQRWTAHPTSSTCWHDIPSVPRNNCWATATTRSHPVTLLKPWATHQVSCPALGETLLQVNRFWTCLPVSYQISNMWSNAKLLVFELSLNRSALGWFQSQGREAFFARMKWVIDLVRGMDLSNQTGFGCCLSWPHCLWSMWTPLDLQSGGMFTVHTFADADTWIMCALIILPYAGGCTHTHIGT